MDHGVSQPSTKVSDGCAARPRGRLVRLVSESDFVRSSPDAGVLLGMSRARPEQLAPQSGPFADVLVREDPDDEEEEEKDDEAVSIRHFHRRQRFGV